MENGIEIIEVRNYKSIESVTVVYVKDGKRNVCFGRTEAEAIENIAKVEKALAEKRIEFAPIAKRSNSGQYFLNNRGVMVEE
jgi:hypothetical protein